MTQSRLSVCIVLALFLVTMSACRSPVPTPAGTGAREVVQKYLEALKQQDWDAAYACLDSRTQTQFSRTGFENRAQAYCKEFDLPTRDAVIRSCEEQGEKAIVHFILADANRTARHRVRDGVVLHGSTNGWAIVLPPNFGSR